MKLRLGSIALFSLLLVLAGFVWLTAQALPPVVASHFSASGAADGFMHRGAYVVLVLALVVGAPLLVAFVPLLVAGQGGRNLSIPDRQYWLAPERREDTLAFIAAHGKRFSAALALFLGYVHWLVVRANELQPPSLSTAGIVSGLVVFFLALSVWLWALFARFGRRA
ncbi:MAG: hypothetical protein KJ011_02910 [Burkholderiaceae bacterium]|nr:hypothetical protein [Burkholderiaceae bacterium]